MNTEPDFETSEQWRKDPNNWVLGLFYFNKNDERLFAPKKIKQFGMTINFANNYSFLIVLAIIVFCFILVGLGNS